MEDLFDVWSRVSRFRCVAIVLDLEVADARALRSRTASADARAFLSVAMQTKARYVVMAGQLLRKKAGVFGLMVAEDMPELVKSAARACFHHLTDKGETMSMWLIFAPEPLRSELHGLIAELAATSDTTHAQ